MTVGAIELFVACRYGPPYGPRIEPEAAIRAVFTIGIGDHLLAFSSWNIQQSPTVSSDSMSTLVFSHLAIGLIGDGGK